MRTTLITVALSISIVALAGCGRLMHPQAGEILEQTKGSSGIETQINLTKRIEESAERLQGQANYEAGLDTLHNELYALKTAGCDVAEAQAKTPAYAKAKTFHKEVGTIFHRLWKAQNNQTLRDLHLDLLAKRVQELREALQAVRG